MKLRKVILPVFFACMLFFLFFVGLNLYMISFSKPFIYTSLDDLPKKYTLIIPGARVYQNTVSPVVRDRIEAGSECIKSGKAEKILISGDHGRKDYDEVNRMKSFMNGIYGIDENLIFMDHAGFSTYETMYRARDIFCVNAAIVTSQSFHTARCVYIARKLGIDCVAYVSPEITGFPQKFKTSWFLRESLARFKSFFLVLFNVKPTYLGEKIPITGEAKLSWD